jgi:hypothetical protein
MHHKIGTLLRMEAWAKHYNEVDGFVADWSNSKQWKYGFTFYENELSIHLSTESNHFIFQICVASEKRAEQMLEKFRTDLEKIFNNK